MLIDMVGIEQVVFGTDWPLRHVRGLAGRLAAGAGEPVEG